MDFQTGAAGVGAAVAGRKVAVAGGVADAVALAVSVGNSVGVAVAAFVGLAVAAFVGAVDALAAVDAVPFEDDPVQPATSTTAATIKAAVAIRPVWPAVPDRRENLSEICICFPLLDLSRFTQYTQ